MKIFHAFAVMYFALTTTLVCHAGEPAPTRSVKLPTDVQRVVDLHLTCLELIRVTREPASVEDRIIRRALQRLRCDRSHEMLLKMKDKYLEDSEILEALQNAESGGAT